ncbi:hypothetical protein [Ohtaekwangia koreensis]|uniref:Uncharacterized protein n=1 Tax=Ohtaekwangia koreensis TaxID=688867 RepID=A0A1T5J8L7_9BACT|nr:hypothetical protein [Ohtaekwangia koreensis]SKC47780.1 hypothetical protein SAMN05660236_0872 [Ohtaekwangia koreensis]
MPMPRDIKYVFRISALHYLHRYLRMVFTQDEIEAMHKTMWAEYKKNPKATSQENFMLEWGETVWQPEMNRRLNRPADHPTFEKLLRVAFKDELERASHTKRHI